jgi:hypothetical protein
MATIQQQLDEAVAAYHKLQTGTMPRVVVDVDGSRVEFTAANASRLNAYILQLQGQIGLTSGVPINVAPASFYF